MSVIAEIIWLTLALSLKLPLTLSAPAVDKTQFFAYLSFNSSLELINGISSDVQNLLKYYNDTAIVAFLKFSFAPCATKFYN